ncbi:MAG: hypothetical protein NC318_01130 [Blautia sp.]|nr:hypothetical protein [Blautia sp.]MCM1222524.1 hypothetical protein [Lachnospiraceae bacterium]
MRVDSKTGLQIIKLTFFLISYAVIYIFSKVDATTYISLFVFIITAWIECMNTSEETSVYKGIFHSKIEKNQRMYEVVGSILGIILVPICFFLMIKIVHIGENSIIPSVYENAFLICYGLSFIFVFLKIILIMDLLLIRKDRKNDNFYYIWNPISDCINC